MIRKKKKKLQNVPFRAEGLHLIGFPTPASHVLSSASKCSALSKWQHAAVSCLSTPPLEEGGICMLAFFYANGYIILLWLKEEIMINLSG